MTLLTRPVISGRTGQNVPLDDAEQEKRRVAVVREGPEERERNKSRKALGGSFILCGMQGCDRGNAGSM